MTERVVGEPLIDASRIEARRSLIAPEFLDSRIVESPRLDEQVGCTVLLKVETENSIRSFKARGTYALLGSGIDTTELVTASAGNFGQGLAWAARDRGTRLTVFASTRASSVKVDAMRRLGATVLLAGEDFDAAKDAARQWSAERGLRFVEDGAEPAIAEGAGTIALELSRDGGDVDVLLVPLGNGALLGGMGAWYRHVAPRTKVVGVVAAGAPCMMLSLQAGRVVESERAETIADGVAVRIPVPEAVRSLSGLVDDVVAVSEESLVRAMQLVYAATSLQVEPAAALGVAALLEIEQWRGLRVATVLTGANFTPSQRAAWFA